MGQVTCISGIDTDIGKTIATGLMAKALLAKGHSVITQKIAQTGCTGIAEDIKEHRNLMGMDLLPEDKEGLTCPYVFSKPCSPHLAAELNDTSLDLEKIKKTTETLAAQYDHVLLEGAGGLMVPLIREVTFLDYLQKQSYPLILVTSPRLGSINHTLAALELAKGRGIQVKGIIYNCHRISDGDICKDSRSIFIQYLSKYGFPPVVVDMQSADGYQKLQKHIDCLALFEMAK